LTASTSNRQIARVALDIPAHQLFDYRADDASAADIGARVEVPFRNKRAAAVIVELASASDAASLKSIGRVFRDSPRLSEETLSLTRFCASYYHHPIGQVVMLALPPLMRRSFPALSKPAGYSLTAAGRALSVSAINPRQLVKRRVLAQFQAKDWIPSEELLAISRRARTVVQELLDASLIQASDPPAVAATDAQPPKLNAEQWQAVEQIQRGGAGFQPWLLQGVTGSGKTEVYLALIADVLKRGDQALILVPEINLTPQLVARITGRFVSVPFAVLHSAMSPADRLRNWVLAQRGAARIVIGTRLAVFTPMPSLSLIVVDEEHDSSYKQQDALRYSARDLAVYRAKARRCPIILGSATPSLESYNQARRKSYGWAHLTRRAMNALLPEVSLVDLTREHATDGISPTVARALAQRLQEREQSLVFINRRGFAPVLWCGNCGRTEHCQRCSANLVLHARTRVLRCHHCGHSRTIPAACETCGMPEMLPLGRGTERIEQALFAHFAGARILRIDRDTTKRRGSWDKMLQSIKSGEADILVGTQIVAKGHDFPGLTLVVVADADQALHASDFRASEKLFAQLMQVAGRAGRASAPGTVIIQTRFPQHPLFAALRTHDYSAFADAQLEERRRARFPPFVYQALLRAEAHERAVVFAFLDRAARHARALSNGGVDVYDPVPGTMSRVAGKERGQLLVQCSSRPTLHVFLERWLQELRAAKSSRTRWSLDVDPTEF
jgi:primosomal protein N' (replication factor Y)